METIIPWSFESTSSAVQDRRNEFCDISKPEVATPPALDAFPGANWTLAAWNAVIASGVEGIFAPSATHFTPFAISAFASASFNSFWVAHGKAISTFTSQGLFPATNFADGYLVAYSEILPRFTFFNSITKANLSAVIPSES